MTATNISLTWTPTCASTGSSGPAVVDNASIIIVSSTGNIDITNGTAGALYRVPKTAYVTASPYNVNSPSGFDVIFLGSGYTVYQGAAVNVGGGDCSTTRNGSASPIYGDITLQSVTISTPNTIINVYQNSTISITFGSGGSGNYEYQWYVDNASVSGGTTSTYVFSSTVVAVHSVYVVVTDTSYNTTTQSNTLNIQVVSAPSVTYYVSGSYLEVGQVCQLNAAVSGGTGSYKYQWYVDGGEIEYANSPLLLYYPTSSGSHVFQLGIIDVGLSNPPSTYTPIGSVVVEFYNPLALTVSPITATILNSSAGSGNTTATITVTATGGSGHYSYQWYADDSIVSGGTTSTYVFSSSDAGVHNIYCEVTDTNSHYVAVTQDVLVNVVGGLSVGVSPTSLDVATGIPFTLVGSVSGGSGNYSYQWLQNSTASTSGATVVASSPSYTGMFNSTGVWYYYFVATDNVTKYSATSSAVTVTVYSGFGASLTSTATNVVVGNSVTLNLYISGGSGNWTATWYQVINGTQTTLTSGSVSSYTVSQSSSTTANYYVVVTDTSTKLQYVTNTVTITWGTTGLSISSSSSNVWAGHPYTITISSYGFISPLTYTLYENGSSIYSISGASSNIITQTITKGSVSGSVNTYSYYATVSDSKGNNATSGTITVNVYPPITASLTSTATNVVAGNNVTLNLSVSGGSGSWTGVWYQNINGSITTLTSGTATSYTVSQSSSVSASYYVVITDTKTNNQFTTHPISISWGGFSINISQSALIVSVGDTYSITMATAGGVPPFSYTLYENGTTFYSVSGITANTITRSIVKSATGTYKYYATATDSKGNSVTSGTVSVVVYSGIGGVLTASGNYFVVDDNATLSLQIAGGSGNWTTTWYQNIGGSITTLTSGSVTSYTVSQSSPVTASYYVIISDNSTNHQFTTNAVSITWGVFTASISATPLIVSTGTSYIITMSSSGGVTPLTYTLYENGTSIYSSSETNSNLISNSISKSSAGTYSYYVTVVDSYNNSATSGAISVVVTSNIGVILTSSTSLIPYNSGQVATLTATSANVSGTPIYNIYEISPSGSVTQVVTNSTVNTYVFNPSGMAEGLYTFYASVSGSNGSAASNYVYVEYSKASAVSTTVSISDSVTYQYIAGGGSISANSPSGQTGNFTVTWNGTVVPAFDITLDRRLNYAGELDFKVPKSYLMNKNDLIQFYYWGNAVFIGRVKEVTKYSDYVYEVKAYDGLYELGGITYGLLPRSNNMSIDSMLKYFINQCKYFGYGSMWYQITQPVGVDFGGSNVLPNLLQLVFAYNGHIAIDNNGNINLFTHTGTVATRTITENSGGFIVQSKEYDNTRIYTKITAVAFDTDENNQKVSYSTGSGNGKVIGDGWLYLNNNDINTNGVLQTIANNIIGQTSQGNWVVTIWTGAHSTFDFPDNSNGAPYLYTINFADGTTLNNMLLAGIKITQNGVTYTFKQYDDTIIDYLLTSIEK
ncbi:MAG: hypothetical protein QXF80_06770 [Thermoplasmatales archaeon]